MQDTFTISHIDPANSHVTVSLSYALSDGSHHTDAAVIANLPVDDAAALTDALNEYLAAYKTGKETELANATPTLSPSVQALIGQAQTYTPPVDNTPPTDATPPADQPTV